MVILVFRLKKYINDAIKRCHKLEKKLGEQHESLLSRAQIMDRVDNFINSGSLTIWGSDLAAIFPNQGFL